MTQINFNPYIDPDEQTQKFILQKSEERNIDYGTMLTGLRQACELKFQGIKINLPNLPEEYVY
jgi:hypothetical protein